MRYLAVLLILAPLVAGAQSASPETVRGFYAGAGIGNAEPTTWDDDYYGYSESGDSDASVSVDDSSVEFLFGFGIGVTVFDRAHLRLEYQNLFIDEDLLAADGDTAAVNTLLLDLQYRFGGGWQVAGFP